MVDRKKLDEIIMKNETNDWWQSELFVKNTKQLLPPELEILSDPPSENQNYNCFIYALDLHENPEILKETNGFIYDSFFKYLLNINELQKTDQPQDGDYVVYQDLENYPDNLTHVGVVDGEKVISKWAWGPLIKHDRWHVPAEYGSEVFYIKAITKEKVLELFDRYKTHNKKPISGE